MNFGQSDFSMNGLFSYLPKIIFYVNYKQRKQVTDVDKNYLRSKRL